MTHDSLHCWSRPVVAVVCIVTENSPHLATPGQAAKERPLRANKACAGSVNVANAIIVARIELFENILIVAQMKIESLVYVSRFGFVRHLNQSRVFFCLSDGSLHIEL